MHSISLNFQAPIKENALFNGEFIIKGIAITSTITDNNHKFLPEELEKAADTMLGIPLMVDHDNSVSSIIGKVKHGLFDHTTQNLEFEAMVDDESIKEKISKGLVDTVSIGATVEDIEEEDGVFIPRGIKIRELSIVAVPADQAARFTIASTAPTFQMALQEALKLSNSKRKIESHTSGFFTYSPDHTGQITTERGLDEMEKEMTELKVQLAEQEAKIAGYEAKERKTLESDYADLCKSKSVEPMNVTNVSNDALDFSIQHLRAIKEADADEEDATDALPDKPTDPVAPTEPTEDKDKADKDEEDKDEDSEDEEVEESGKYRIFQTSDSDSLTGNIYTVEMKNPVSSNYR